MNKKSLRSNKAIAVSGCLLHQSLMAVDCEAAPAIIKTVVEWALNNDIGLIPWTCPETVFAGLPRKPKGIERYRSAGLGTASVIVAESFAEYLAIQIKGGINILAVVGVSFSPACSARRQAYHKNEQGLFIQALVEALDHHAISLPVIDIKRNNSISILTTLDKILMLSRDDLSSGDTIKKKPFNLTLADLGLKRKSLQNP